MSTDRHRILECFVCKKRMRSDSFKRHRLKKHKNFNFQVTTIFKTYVKGSGNPSDQNLESEILANNKLLDVKIELDEKISKVLTNANTKEESLSKKHKEALPLTQVMMSNFIPANKRRWIYCKNQPIEELYLWKVHEIMKAKHGFKSMYKAC